MKKLMLVLATTLMAASAPQTDEGLRVRYRDFSGQMSITVEHDMYVAERAEPIAARDFTFELTQAVDPAAATIPIGLT